MTSCECWQFGGCPHILYGMGETCQNAILRQTMARHSLNDDTKNKDSVGINNLEYGICQARGGSTFLHRDSSSLYPSQFMDVDYYLAAAQYLLVTTMSYIHLLVNYVSLFHHVSRLLALWKRISLPPLVVLRKLRGAVDGINKNAAHLTHLITWVRSHDKVTLLYAGDIIYFVRERRQRFHPKNN